ncbi:LOW QUALITY PROTEIN: hypothetical protein HID58_019592 [Brassica napus]|uniref:RING-type E3 ubiquitin transferase n=1 Tax=Brassica napus TaxID=3708 RepID=A0ABQ8DFW9_BRANA|nr:LOW QUALITY PROTEIN: hypothetical protein HID58_019592 [Brassica napus]
MLQSVVVILIYAQIGCAMIGSLGALYNGVLLINLAIALFALVAIESNSQSLGRTYAVLLFCAILLDISWLILFSSEIWNISSEMYKALYIFSVKLTMAMEIAGFVIYRLGASIVDTSLPRRSDSDSQNSFVDPPCLGSQRSRDPDLRTSLLEPSTTAEHRSRSDDFLEDSINGPRSGEILEDSIDRPAFPPFNDGPAHQFPPFNDGPPYHFPSCDGGQNNLSSTKVIKHHSAENIFGGSQLSAAEASRHKSPLSRSLESLDSSWFSQVANSRVLSFLHKQGLAMEDANAIRYWCHMCSRSVNPVIEGEVINCNFCQSGFVEEMDETPEQATNDHPHQASERRHSAAILDLLQGIRAGLSVESENNQDNNNQDNELVVLINSFNQRIRIQDSVDASAVPSGSLGDYFIGPGFEMLLQRLAENDPNNRYGTPPATKEAVESLETNNGTSVDSSSNNPSPPEIADIMRVSSHREVYEPCDDSFALVDALLADQTNLINHNPNVCMEIGCGSGYVITSLILLLKPKLPNVHYLATDTNPIAARVTNQTLEAHGVKAEIVCTDIASCLEERLAGSVDVMVVNPPYVPTPEYEVGMEGIASAWAGGENGRSVIDRMLPVVDRLLSEKGWFYLVTLSSNYPAEICLMMRKRGFAWRILVQRSTEEENLVILKFWRDRDEVSLEKETSSASLVSEFSRSLSSFMEKQWRQMTDQGLEGSNPVDLAEHPSGIVPTLQNIVSTVNLDCKLDLKAIALQARNAEYNPKRFAAVIMRIREPKTTALIFASGKMVCTGAKSEYFSKMAARKYARIVQKLGFPAKFKDFKIQNIVGSCDVKFPIRLEGLAYSHAAFSSYEPELFPGLIYRMKVPKIVLLIFVSGKIVITGAKSGEFVLCKS